MYDYHQKAVKVMNYRSPEILNPPEIVPQFLHVWKWFDDLHVRRQTGMGIMPFTFSEVREYLGLFRIDYNPIELDILFLIDNIYLKENSKEGVEDD